MSINFSTGELQRSKINLYAQEVVKENLNQSQLPTDIHLIEYEMNGVLYCDAVRAFKLSDVFDVYYDKLNKMNGKIISITNGYGTISPKLWKGNAEDS